MGAFTYPRSEPGSAGHLDLVEQLNAHAFALRRELAGLPDATLSARPAEGEWSIKDTLGHLCDVGRISHQRLFMMVRLEEPRLAGYDTDEMARASNAQAAKIEDLLAEFATQRAATVELLAELVHWNWARQGRHEVMGRISIRQQVELWLAHEENHLAQIRSLKEQAAG